MEPVTSPALPALLDRTEADGIVFIALELPVPGCRVIVEWRDGAGELHCEVLSPERSRAWATGFEGADQ
jgi:hypothetical protein